MKDFLNNCAKRCDESIKYYNQYFNSRVEQYYFNGLGADISFQILVSKNDVNSTDFMYYVCYQECVGKLDLIGALINKVGE